jgi:hypothetical protein
MGEPTTEEMLQELDNIYMKLKPYPFGTDIKILGAIRKLIEHRPKVTREFVEKWTKSIMATPIMQDDKIFVCQRMKLETMLIEAGMEVSDDLG